MDKLDDVLDTGLDLVFCGTAASAASALQGHYYAGPGNRFWAILWETALTNRLLAPSDCQSLLDYGIGLTDIVKDQAGTDSEIEFGRRGKQVQKRIEPYSPRYLCFNGKRATMEAMGRNQVRYGLQEESFGYTRIFIAPSTSAVAKRWWDGCLWHELAALVHVRGSAGATPGWRNRPRVPRPPRQLPR